MQNKLYFEALGVDVYKLTANDHTRLREAYIRAHDIRKFEIEMYWRRSAYLWTLQAAALAGLAAIFATSGVIAWECHPKFWESSDSCQIQRVRLVTAIAVWAFGLVSSIVWVLLLIGAKFWQENWERHLDYLEDFFSGPLYKTYPTEDRTPPYSVTKLNLLMARFMVFLWLVVGVFSGSIILDIGLKGIALITIPVVFSVFFGVCFFDSEFRMSGFGKLYSKEKTSRGHLIVRR